MSAAAPAPPASRSGRSGADAAPAAALVIYVLLVAVVGAHHRPWFDEAQAWLIARDSDLGGLFLSGVRYEGTPALWHLVLWTAMRLGLPYGAFWTVSAALGSAGAALVLFRAPFPLLLRLAVVFSYFFAYQYAVVARSYALDLVLVPLAAILFDGRVTRPLPYFAVLALMANTNAHSFFVAAVLALEAAAAGRARALAGRWTTLAAIALFGAAALAAAAQAYPPADINFLLRRPGETLLSRLSVALQLAGEAFVDRVDPALASRPSELSRLAGVVLSACLLAPAAGLFHRAGRGLLALGLLCALVGFSAVKYGNAWHAGIIFLAFVFCLWTAWDAAPALGRRERRLLAAALGILLAVSDADALVALLRDRAGVYSAAEAVARVLPRAADGRVAGPLGVEGFKGFAVQPYFAANVFANYEEGRPRPAYYVWRRSQDPIPGVTEASWRALLARSPERVLLSTFNLMGLNGPYRFSRDARLAGYCLEAAFPGEMIWKTYVLETDDMVLFRRCPPGFRRPAAEILRGEGGRLLEPPAPSPPRAPARAPG